MVQSDPALVILCQTRRIRFADGVRRVFYCSISVLAVAQP